MEKKFDKKQVGAIGLVIAIVTAAIMLFLQMFGITTPNEPKQQQNKTVIEINK